jgi:hypothetical protein
MHRLSADLSVHEASKHLGMGHLYCEAFAIAHNNVYVVNKKKIPGSLLMGNLIKPHITSLVALNIAARLTLVIDNETNTLDPFMGLSGREFV